jgi:transcriptional regulator with XRE-family HTH domain
MEQYPRLSLIKTGRRIKELRESCGLKVEQIANKLGLAGAQAVYKWERGSSMPSIDNLVMLSYIFNTNIDDIIRTTENSSFLMNFPKEDNYIFESAIERYDKENLKIEPKAYSEKNIFLENFNSLYYYGEKELKNVLFEFLEVVEQVELEMESDENV